MEKSLHQVVYVSRRSPGVGDDEVVDEIALPSYRRNRAMGITGCLWFDNAHFVQFIEGPGEAVLSTYARILNDGRHTDIREIASRPVQTRAYGRFALQLVRDDTMDPVKQLIGLTFGDRWTARAEAELLAEILRTTDLAMESLTKVQSGI